MSDTGRARLPGIPAVTDSNVAQVVRLLVERSEVREGARGNPAEAVVTKRDLEAVTKVTDYLSAPKRTAQAGDAIIDLGGGLTASIAVEQFAESIKGSKLFKDLQYKLDNPERFNFLPEDIRRLVTGSVADEAARLGASVTRVENKLQSEITSLASTVEQVTAAVANAAAGVREVTYAYAQADKAQAGKITTIEARLNGVGGVTLEQQMTVTADKVSGLEGKYTVKINAGGAIAGFGLAAYSNNGATSSAFIIQADKFALVSSAYTNGLTNTPSPASVPFGVDMATNSLFLNGSVYLNGTLKIDSPTGKPLSAGLRGSVTVSASATSWDDNVARAAVNAAIGKAGDLTNNWLVIGDMVTITNASTLASETRQWMGSGWLVPGAVINGNLLVDGTIAATKINTRGLDIKDASGNVIFSSGIPLSVSRITGLGALATQNSVSTVSVGGIPLDAANLCSTLRKISSGTISNFMDTSAITTAYIGEAQVDTLRIGPNAVTVPFFASVPSGPQYTYSTWSSYDIWNPNAYPLEPTIETKKKFIRAGTLIMVIATSTGTHYGFHGHNNQLGVRYYGPTEGAAIVSQWAVGGANASFENFANITSSGSLVAQSDGYYSVVGWYIGEAGGSCTGFQISAFGGQR